MTLCIRVVTSLGVVIIADSLVTQSKPVEVITSSEKKLYLNKDQTEYIYPEWPTNRSTPVLIDRNYLATEPIISSTSPNVKKLYDFPRLNVGFAFAGTADFEYCYVKYGGIRHQPIPPEIAVKTIVKESLDLIFDEPMFAADVGECISLALTSSLIRRMRNRRQAVEFQVMGGGYSKQNPFPTIFDYNLDIRTGTGRFDILNGVSRCLSNYLKHMLPMYCTSRNWFEEFMKNELDNLISYCVTDAIWWSFSKPFSSNVIINQIIPDVEYHIVNTLKMVENVLSDEVCMYERDEVNLSDLIKVAYETSRNYDWSYSEQVSNAFKNQEASILEMINYHDSHSWEDFCGRVEATIDHFVREIQEKSYSTSNEIKIGYRDRLPEEQKSILSENAFNTLYFINTDMVPRATLALSFVNTGYRYEPGGDKSVGISHIGQGDVLQRIIQGMDDNTRRKMSTEIRDFQMHATKRFTQLLTARLQSVEAPEPTKFQFYQSDKRDSATSYKEPPNLTSKKTNKESVETKLFDFDGNQRSELQGIWKGQFSLRIGNENSEEKATYNCEIELLQLKDAENENEKIWGGSGTVDNAQIELDNINWDGNIIEFRMRIKGHEHISSDEEYKVDGKMTEWGLDCVFTTEEGSREYLLLTREVTNSEHKSEEQNDGIDANLIQSVLSELYLELEEFQPPYESYWDIDYIHMPLENAVDLAKYLMESTIRKQQFNSEVPTVGGPIVTLVITKDGGIKRL